MRTRWKNENTISCCFCTLALGLASQKRVCSWRQRVTQAEVHEMINLHVCCVRFVQLICSKVMTITLLAHIYHHHLANVCENLWLQMLSFDDLPYLITYKACTKANFVTKVNEVIIIQSCDKTSPDLDLAWPCWYSSQRFHALKITDTNLKNAKCKANILIGDFLCWSSMSVWGAI